MSAASAQAMSFKANMQSLRLPVTIGLALPPDQSDAAPGEMTVGLQRMCGDGDVANLAKTNPDIQFVPQDITKLDIVAGYWVVDGADDANPVPTPSNFMPVGYIKGQSVANLPSTVQIANLFLPMNHSVSEGKNGLEILAAEVVNIYKNANRAYASNKTFRMYAGVFTCLDMDDASGLVSADSSAFKFMPSSTEITNQFSHSSGLPKLAYDAFNSVSENNYKDNKIPNSVNYQFGSTSGSLLKYPVESVAVFSPLKITFDQTDGENGNHDNEGEGYNNGKGGASLTGTPAFTQFKKILDLQFPDLKDAPISAAPLPSNASQADKDKFAADNPTDADKIRYLNSKINEWKNTLAINPSPDQDAKISYCQSLGINTDRSVPSFRWEVFPMNVSCKKLFNENESISSDKTSLSAAYKDLTSTIATSADMATLRDKFWSIKKTLAMRYYVANATNVLQKSLQTNSDLKISHANCFNSGSKPLITRLVGSYPIRFTLSGSAYTTSPNPFNHLHPEPLFALSDWKNYASSDIIGIWGQVVNRTPYYPPGAFSGVTGGVDGSIDPGSIILPDPIPATPINPLEWGVYLPINDSTELSKNKVEGKTFKGPAINILFKIRSIGGSCPGFC
jgi:hypothetical protein